MSQPVPPSGPPASPSGPQPGATAPASPSPSAGPRSGNPGGAKVGLIAIAISLLAVVVALSSAAFAWRAIDQAKDAKDIALSKPGGIVPTNAADGAGESSDSPPNDIVTEPTAQTGPTPGGAPRSPGEPPELNEQTTYNVKYSKQELTLKADCGYSMYADLDEPRANVDQAGHDLRFTVGCNSEASSFRLGEGVRGSDFAQTGMTPQECAESIRSSPIANAAKVPARKGTLICLHTSYTAARERGDSWRIVLVEVVAVGNDGATTIQATSWDIPG